MKFSRFCGLFRSRSDPFPSCPVPRRLKCGTYIILPSQPLVVNRFFCFFQNFFPVLSAVFCSVFRTPLATAICDSFIILTLCGHPVNTGFAKLCRFFAPFYSLFFPSLYIRISHLTRGIWKQRQTEWNGQNTGLFTPCIFFCTCWQKTTPSL